MNVIIATGGLDEMAIDVNYDICFGLFVIIAGLLAIAWWKQSLLAAGLAAVVVLLDGIFIQPWYFAVSRPPDGPYDQTWQFNMRVISVLWLLTVILTAVELVRELRYRIRRNEKRSVL